MSYNLNIGDKVRLHIPEGYEVGMSIKKSNGGLERLLAQDFEYNNKSGVIVGFEGVSLCRVKFVGNFAIREWTVPDTLLIPISNKTEFNSLLDNPQQS